MTRRVRAVGGQGLAGAATMALAVAIGVAIPLVPLVRDDRALDWTVRAVALDMRDFGPEKARERLAFEIASQGLDRRVRSEDCVVEPKRVACVWGVVVEVPWLARRVPLRFESEAELGEDGGLE